MSDVIAEKRAVLEQEVKDSHEGPFLYPPTTLGDVMAAADAYARAAAAEVTGVFVTDERPATDAEIQALEVICNKLWEE